MFKMSRLSVKDICKTTFFYRVVGVWHMLPDELLEANTPVMFGRYLDK